MNNRNNIYQHFKDAKSKKYAIPAFNFDNLEMLKAITEVASEDKVFLIAMATESAAKYIGLEFLNLLKQITNINPYLIFHWDHGFTKDLALKAVLNHWNSVMYDGSKRSFDTNVKESNEVKTLALANDVWTEFEIGPIGGKEDDQNLVVNKTTSFSEVCSYYEKVKPDLLAVAVGSCHGFYKGKVEINFQLIESISNHYKDIFLVLHGGSGIPDQIVKEAIRKGIVKVNFGTELKKAYADGIQQWFINNPHQFDGRKYGRVGIDNVKKVIRKKITLCQTP